MQSYLSVKVWGEMACFTRPEMKVERVSYPVMTPSAARGVLEAIYWKPEFEWRVREIHVLKPIRHIALVRNEVSKRIPTRDPKPIFVDEERTQRYTLALRDVAYLIHAEIVLRDHADKDIAAYRDQFRRRVERGDCYFQPYLGCREFSAYFAPPTGGENPIRLNDDLGRMLGELRYEGNGKANPIFFHAYLRNGVLTVPDEIYRR
ncbi:MAG: type I-C CRISPR-associated protein Cas5 [Fimbriimonadales bacterium]|nr:MAG: type I-C CRISPR-associated protein Cas5 [Fimbriimonadales bacterium]